MQPQGMTAAELLFLQEHFRSCMTMIRTLNHVSNETNDQEFKTLCNRMMQDHMQGVQRFSKYIPGIQH